MLAVYRQGHFMSQAPPSTYRPGDIQAMMQRQRRGVSGAGVGMGSSRSCGRQALLRLHAVGPREGNGHAASRRVCARPGLAWSITWWPDMVCAGAPSMPQRLDCKCRPPLPD